jgi:hypothetical protein
VHSLPLRTLAHKWQTFGALTKFLYIGDMATFSQLYSNIFGYPLYIGLCLLLMLIYSAIYMLLAIYVERLNPGEFGVSQPWYYLFKKSYWTSSAIGPTNPEDNFDKIHNGGSDQNHWIEMNNMERKKNSAMSINHLTKVEIFFTIF